MYTYGDDGQGMKRLAQIPLDHPGLIVVIIQFESLCSWYIYYFILTLKQINHLHYWLGFITHTSTVDRRASLDWPVFLTLISP